MLRKQRPVRASPFFTAVTRITRLEPATVYVKIDPRELKVPTRNLRMRLKSLAKRGLSYPVRILVTNGIHCQG